MKKLLFFILAVVLFTACNRVAPNYEGVLMQNYGENGRSDYSSVLGNQGILGPGSELFQVPMYEQTADVDDEGNLIEIDNDFPFLYDRHWIKQYFDLILLSFRFLIEWTALLKYSYFLCKRHLILDLNKIDRLVF